MQCRVTRDHRVGPITPRSASGVAVCCAGCNDCGADLPAGGHSGPSARWLAEIGVDASNGQPPPRFDVQPVYIGPYRILELIGEGGMGRVYRAEQEDPIRRRVALKVLKAGVDTREVLARFEAERQVMALMDHPNIARALDAGVTDRGRPYFVMELIKGEPITRYRDRYRLSISDQLKLFVPICRAIQHAHHKGIIHRDLKPSNILVTLVDGDPVAKIIDFGIAKATGLSVSDRTLYTRHGEMIGTPEYMSPEQAENNGLDVDTRTDVYSLGAVLYELLTGATPFDGGSLRRAGCAEIQRILRDHEPMRPSARVTSLAGASGVQTDQHGTDTRAIARMLRDDLDWIVLKAMAKDRTRRYETADALAEDIGRYLRNEPVMAGPPSATYRLRKLARRNRAAFAMLGAICFGVVAASSALAFALLESERQNQRVEAALGESEAVKSFLAKMLASVDPVKEGSQVTVQEILDESAESIGRQFEGQPEMEADLQSIYGETYAALGLYDRAESHLKRALDLRGQTRGEDSEKAVASLFALAGVYGSAGRFDDAATLYRKVIDLTRRTRGEEHPDALAAMNSLVSLPGTVARPKRVADTEAMARRALEIGRRKLGDEHPVTLTSMQCLADVIWAQGRFSEAKPLYDQAIGISRTLHGDSHPQTIRLRQALAWAHFGQEQYEQAGVQFELALANARELWGEAHPRTLELVADLGMSHKSQGRYEEAERLYLDGLDVARRRLGPDHPSALYLQNNLGQLYRRQGRRDEAVEVLKQTFEAQSRLYGERHPWTFLVMRNLGAAYKEKGLYAEAERLLRGALENSRLTDGDDFHYTRSSLSALASLYDAQGRRKDAQAIRNLLSETRN